MFKRKILFISLGVIYKTGLYKTIKGTFLNKKRIKT
jgi:hypothetical protein